MLQQSMGQDTKAMPIFNVTIESLDKKAREAIEIAGVEINDFTTIRRLDVRRLKQEFAHFFFEYIMSGKGHMAYNKAPTKEELRKWEG